MFVIHKTKAKKKKENIEKSRTYLNETVFDKQERQKCMC